VKESSLTPSHCDFALTLTLSRRPFAFASAADFAAETAFEMPQTVSFAAETVFVSFKVSYPKRGSISVSMLTNATQQARKRVSIYC
jgi:hypothetical protein